MDDMDALQTVSDVEQAALVNKLIAGDASASTPLVESKLKKVADIAKKYCGKGVTFGDLIQEGNLELMVAVSEYTKECGDFNNYIDKRIEQGIRRNVRVFFRYGLNRMIKERMGLSTGGFSDYDMSFIKDLPEIVSCGH